MTVGEDIKPGRWVVDTAILFTGRIVRLFAYGFLSVVLVLYLAAIGIDEHRIGLLLTLTLIGDVAVSLILTTRADAIGRRRTLAGGAVLMVIAAIAFAATRDFTLLVIAATIGVISPSGNEVGPFIAVEQVALAQSARPRDRTAVFAWYNLAGSFATATGSLAAGVFTGMLISHGFGTLASYRSVVVGYAVMGAILAVLFLTLSSAVEDSRPRLSGQRRAAVLHASVHRSRGVVARLASLFALDSFAGGLVIQSIVAYWFYRRFGISPALIGSIFFAANLLAGFSALAAARIARRIGLLNTMVFTHLPSNVLLILIPFMPSLPLAIAILLLRFSISQMDVPTRQSYVIAAVDESEQTAAAGITGVARTMGAALAPVLAMPVITGVHQWLPFVVAGVLKIIYDLLLWWNLRGLKTS